uniref:C3H1-type domain-containing protein n=1 Tax=Mesocestoides corti TaxID=53468 RepID=A0A5K3FZT2_MESCO
MLSVDSGIGENFFSPTSFSFTSTNSVGELVHPPAPAGFTRDEAPPSQTASAVAAAAAASTSFDFTPATRLDSAALKQAAVAVGSAASSVTQSSPSIELTAGGTAPLLRSLIWPPSWPNTNDCTSTATPKPHFRPGDNQQHQFALFSRFESAIRQQQQPSRSYNRRKAESNCFVPATHLNQALTLPTTLSGHTKSHSLTAAATVVGQLGSPSGELCQSESKSYAATPLKFTRDLQQQPSMNAFTKAGNGFPSGSKAIAPRSSGPCRSKRIDTTPSFSSSSSTSSSDASDKPIVAKWRRACSFYLRGHCKKEDCEFAHDLTKVTCKFWEVGECFKGMTCPFLHGYPPEFLLELQQRQNQQAEQLTSNG